MIWAIVCLGFSEPYGFWKMYWIRRRASALPSYEKLPAAPDLPEELRRAEPPRLPEVPEFELVRHLKLQIRLIPARRLGSFCIFGIAKFSLEFLTAAPVFSWICFKICFAAKKP